MRALLARRLLLALLALLTCLPNFVDARVCEQYDTLQIQLKWLQQAQFAGYIVAVENGYYRDECLEVYIRPGGPNINMEEEVVSNRAQFGIDWLSTILERRQGGLDVVLISQTFARTGNSEITMRSSGIDTPQKLRDKNVCVWLGGNELSMRALFDANNLVWDNDTSVNRQDGSSANIVSQAFTNTEFLAGRCDAASATRYNELALIYETQNPRTGELYKEDDLFIFDYNTYNVSTYEDGIFVSKAWIALPGNRDLAVRFLRASMKGWAYGRDYPDLVIDTVFGRSVHQRWMLNEINKLIYPSPWNAFGAATEATLQDSADKAWRYGILRARALVSEFYRSDIATEAHQGYLGLISGVAATSGWDRGDGVLGSANVLGLGYDAPKLRFCYNGGDVGTLAICEGTRVQDPLDFLSASEPAGVALLSLASLSLAFILSLTAGLVYYRHERNIVASSLPFCLVISLGATVFVSSVFLSTGQADTVKCHARVWMMGLGFVAMMGSFVVKVQRINTIFNSTTLVARKLDNSVLFRAIGLLLGVEVLFLALFSGLSGFEVENFADAKSGRLVHTLCQVHDSSTGDALIGVLFGYKALILLYGLLLAYQTRNVVSQFNESKFLALAVYNQTFISVIVVCLVFFLGMKPVNQTIVADIGIVCAVSLSFGMLMFPKLLVARGGEADVRADPTYLGGAPATGLDAGKARRGSGSKTSVHFNGGLHPDFPNPQLLISENTATMAMWSRGLATLSKDNLVSQLRHLRSQADQVHGELAARGLKGEEIDQAVASAVAAEAKPAHATFSMKRGESRGSLSVSREKPNPSPRGSIALANSRVVRAGSGQLGPAGGAAAGDELPTSPPVANRGASITATDTSVSDTTPVTTPRMASVQQNAGAARVAATAARLPPVAASAPPPPAAAISVPNPNHFVIIPRASAPPSPTDEPLQPRPPVRRMRVHYGHVRPPATLTATVPPTTTEV